VKSRGKQRRKKKRRFERAGTLVLGRARAGRMPAPSHLSLSWLRNVSLLLLAVGVAGALWLCLDGRFYIPPHPNVEGTVRVLPAEVFQISGLSGLHILWVQPAEVESRILDTLPNLESARVACKLPAHCTISVEERQPRMMWDDDGERWWIDAAGVVFPASSSFPPLGGDEGGEGWVIRGPLPQGEDGLMDERVRVGLTELWATGFDGSEELFYVPGRGLVLTDKRGWRVIVGQGTGMARRLQVLEWLAADLETRGLTPRFVDVRFPDAPYYSLTKDW